MLAPLHTLKMILLVPSDGMPDVPFGRQSDSVSWLALRELYRKTKVYSSGPGFPKKDGVSKIRLLNFVSISPEIWLKGM